MIEGAFRVLDEFEAVNERHTEAMKALQLQPPEEIAFATAALALRFGERGGRNRRAPAGPVTPEQLIEARRPEDIGHSLWTTFQRVQENVIRGGSARPQRPGRRLQTRPAASTAA